MKLNELVGAVQSIAKEVQVSIQASHAKQIVFDIEDGIIKMVKGTLTHALLVKGEEVLAALPVEDPLVELPLQVGLSLLQECIAKKTAQDAPSTPVEKEAEDITDAVFEVIDPVAPA